MPRVKLDSDSQAAVETTEPIHVKYRPRKLKDVLGQDAVVKSLKAAMAAKARPHTFLFTGPPGTGKTTLARILANDAQCDPNTLIEVDAASKSGVDDARALLEGLRYHGFGDNPNKAIIVDECHRLSKQAWDAFLKITEEPPEHVYFYFCSTEPDKVPAAIRTRASDYQLKPVKRDVILDLLDMVCEGEGYKTEDRILGLVADACEGSPRAALTMLAKVHACDDEDEAAGLLASVMENAEVIELARLLCFGDPKWSDVTRCVQSLDVPPETVRILITNYAGACLVKPKDMRRVPHLLDVLQAFSKPCNQSDKWAPVFLACGKLIYP